MAAAWRLEVEPADLVHSISDLAAFSSCQLRKSILAPYRLLLLKQQWQQRLAMPLQGRATLTRCVYQAGGWGAVWLLLPRQCVHPTTAADIDTYYTRGISDRGNIDRSGSALGGGERGRVGRGAGW